jgi:hypothetical protein
MAEAEIKAIAKPTINFLRDTVKGKQRLLKIQIIPNRKVNRYDIFANEKLVFHNFRANGAKSLGQKNSLLKRNGNKILSYYVVDNLPLEMEFSIPAGQKLDLQLLESSFDLMSNPMFSVAKRKDWMMPMPFVLNDAVAVFQKIKPSPKVSEEKPVLVWRKMDKNGITTTVNVDSIQ